MIANLAFDDCVCIVGVIGEALRGPRGKLGLSGVLWSVTSRTGFQRKHVSIPTPTRPCPRVWLMSCRPSGGADVGQGKDSYLVDPASSHMLVSKIKPCMSKYKLLIR